MSIGRWLLFTVACSSLLSAADRKIYPYSIVPGGVFSDAEVRSARASDPLVDAHYSGTAKWKATRVMFPTLAYVSFRKGNRIVWSRKPVELRPGELLLTDEKHLLRARCGNRVVFTLPPPGTVVPPDEPSVAPPVAFALPPPDAVVPPDEPSLAPPDEPFTIPHPEAGPPVPGGPLVPGIAPPITSSFPVEDVPAGGLPYSPNPIGGGGLGGYHPPSVPTQQYFPSSPPVVTPESGTLELFGSGIIGLAGALRRKIKP